MLRRCGMQPTPQRIAVVDSVFKTTAHPSAEEVLKNVRKDCPTLSRATVYNTLNLLVEKGLLKAQVLKEGSVVFDPNIQRHHHFVDEDSGQIYDVPWDTFKVPPIDSLPDYEITEVQVVVRGRKKRK
ncbi:MAG: hypothetical protein A2Y94_01030 [Caldithrix sp. RBG_13_44_9]|nr:MAG: hypothetical protein A2Y94_01030 [Caldithrix sp. RBG_13_44_9]